MDWTKEQKEAIELRNKNILVAAAAGSGKTAVLVERIKRLILEEKCSVDRMLIVTFTNAAAAEMKEKIQKTINSEISAMIRDKPDSDDISFLKHQLSLISSANISTFHSFALDVIRRYFYLLKIEPDFSICDQTQEALLRGEAMDDLLSELFEEGSEEFYHFLKCYSGDRNETRFREIIDNCYNTIRSLPEPFDWLRDNVARIKDGESLRNGKGGEALFRIAKNKMEGAEQLIEVNHKIAVGNGLKDLIALCHEDRSALRPIEDAIEEKNYDGVKTAIINFKLPTLSGKYFEDKQEFKPDVTKNRNSIKKIVKDLIQVFFRGSLDEVCHDMDLTYSSCRYLEKLLLRYHSIFCEKKSSKKLADFSDIEHYAYDILKDEEASGFYRDKFEHIFIDEYQDSNVIQEALIDLIKRPDNLFMVGDIKQSIYKFRLAEPEIFQNKYRQYQNGEVPDSTKIDLNKNFRSKKNVINFINAICKKMLPDYDEAAMLYMGDPYGEESYDSPALYLAEVPWDESSEIDDELKNIIKAEKEAMAACSIISKNLGTEIFDSVQKKKRPLEKRDIVILMRGVKRYGDIYYKILTENNLPAFIDDNDGFFNTLEVDAFLSALYIIDNPKQDVQLLTLLRSEMMGFSIEELVRIRIEHKSESYYSAFLWYSTSGSDNDLKEKCKKSLEKIQEWRELSGVMPLDKLIWKLLLDTGFYIAMGALPAGSQRQGNLRALADKALKYQSEKDSSLYGFIRYIEAIKNNKVSMGQVKLLGEKDDLIRIMTVHKSKGLEFPMVLLSGYCRRLNYSTAGKSPLIHKDLGIAFPIVDPDRRFYKITLLQNMIKDRIRQEEVEEEKRILYVALTRAKDKLFLLGMTDDFYADVDEVKLRPPSDGSYFQMTGRTIAEERAIKKIDDNDLLSLSKGNKRNIDAILDLMDGCKNLDISKEIERLMSFRYPYMEDLTIRTKYSVSQLNSGGRKSIESLMPPAFAYDEAGITSMGRGTVYHSVLEHMDIKKAHEEGCTYIKELIDEMIKREMITEEEAEILELTRLEQFASSELAARIARSPEVHKERRFNLLTTKDGHQVMVRGIIDCYFEEDDGLVLLDYKTGNKRDAAIGNDEAIRERYKVQMELYSEALREATGKPVKEAYLYLTDAGRIIKI